MTKRHEWGTPTLGVAAAVMALGAEYVRTDRTNPRSMVFYFCVPEDRSGLDKIFGELGFSFDEVERNYVNRQCKLPDAQAYYLALQNLKTVIHRRE